MPGRVMGGFYVLPDGDVSDWVRRSYDYILTLPAKTLPVEKTLPVKGKKGF